MPAIDAGAAEFGSGPPSMEMTLISEADVGFVDRVRGQRRSLSTDDRERMAAIASKRPKVDLKINFDYNSATMTSGAEPQSNNVTETRA